MRTAAAVALLVAVAAALAAIILAIRHGGGEGEGGRGLLIVVTFPNLVGDVEQLLCSDDSVVSLAPPGVDPHSYQLRPRDLDLLRSADLVVSTGHAGFEIKLRSIVGNKLFEITNITGIRLLKNPVTGTPVYHMPIYDPENYKVFIEALAEKLAKLRPSCADHYRGEASGVASELDAIVSSTPRLGLTAVASGPAAIYAVDWLGVKVVHLLVPEHGAAPSQEMLARAEKLLRSGAAAVVMVDAEGGPATAADEKLLELAEETGAGVLRVPAPFLPGSMLEKIRSVAEEASRLAAARGG